MQLARWLVGLLSIGYLVGGTYYYLCTLKQVYCYGTDQVVRALPLPPVAAPADDERPVVFAPGVARPRYHSAHWAAYRDSVIAALPADHTLEIVGSYFADETAPPRAANMGMARAAALRRNIGARLPDERILLTARRLPPRDTAAARWRVLSDFSYLPTNGGAEVVALPDRVLVYFPPAATAGDIDPEISAYLDRLAEQLELTEQQLQITGHTDTDGPAILNRRLGLDRARAIGTLLRGRGVDTSRLVITSMGETDPMAANDTPLGKQRNRRVELRLID